MICGAKVTEVIRQVDSSLRTWRKWVFNSILKVEEEVGSSKVGCAEERKVSSWLKQLSKGTDGENFLVQKVGEKRLICKKVKPESFSSDELRKCGGVKKEIDEEPWILISVIYLKW